MLQAHCKHAQLALIVALPSLVYARLVYVPVSLWQVVLVTVVSAVVVLGY